MSGQAERMDPEQIEIHAMHNDPLPDGLNMPEQLLFMEFRCLHQSVRAGQFTREQAHTEKIKLMEQFDTYMRWEGIYQDTCKMRVELSKVSKCDWSSDVCSSDLGAVYGFTIMVGNTIVLIVKLVVFIKSGRLKYKFKIFWCRFNICRCKIAVKFYSWLNSLCKKAIAKGRP